MEMTGTLVADAIARNTKNDKKVVAFTIVLNDDYKTKNGEKKEVRTFIQCAYWNSTKIADYLKKGCVVTVSGTLGINAYKKGNDEIKADITLNARTMKIVSWGSKAANAAAAVPAVAAGASETKDDLPF